MDPWTICNCVRLFRGKPSEAHLLINKTTRDALNMGGANTVRIITDSGTVLTSTMYIHKLDAVNQGTDSNQCWYIELRDARSIADLTYIDITPTAILNTHRLIDGTQPAAVTWQAVLNALWAVLPSAAQATTGGTCPTLGYTPVSNSENIALEGLSTWEAITKCLGSCGNVALFNNTAETYSFVQFDGTQAALTAFLSANSDKLVWSSVPSEVDATNYPASVGVVFAPHVITNNKQIWYSTPYALEVATGAATAVAGTRITLQDCTRVEYDSTATRTNDTQTANRKTDMAHMIKGVCRAASARLLNVYYGYVALVPGEEISSVTYCNDRQNGFVTKVECFGPMEFPHIGSYPPLAVREGRAPFIVVTPEGGVPPRAGAYPGPWTDGCADCYLAYEYYDDEAADCEEAKIAMYDPPIVVRCYNTANLSLAEFVPVKGIWLNGLRKLLWECT
jgi:hypothetical protein